MQLSAADLRYQIIRPTLSYLGLNSPVTEELLLTTAAMESGFDPLCTRHGGIGIFQINPQQHRQIWDQHLAFEPDCASRVRGLASQHRFLQDPDQELRSNLSYATAIAWLMYRRCGVEVVDDASPDLLCELWQACFHPGNGSQQLFERFRGCLQRYRVAA